MLMFKVRWIRSNCGCVLLWTCSTSELSNQIPRATLYHSRTVALHSLWCNRWMLPLRSGRSRDACIDACTSGHEPHAICFLIVYVRKRVRELMKIDRLTEVVRFAALGHTQCGDLVRIRKPNGAHASRKCLKCGVLKHLVRPRVHL